MGLCGSDVLTGVLQGFKEFSEALPQSPKSDEDRDREFQEQL